MKKGVDPIGIRFELPRLVCLKCNYTWTPRKKGQIYDCPSCRSLDWNSDKKVFIKRITIKCPKCKHRWAPYSNQVSECPKCKQRIYRKEPIKK